MKSVKVPVIMQMDSLECGAASLAMILAYYGKWVDACEIREACGVSRDGSSGKNLLAAARNYGLEGRGHRVKSIDTNEISIPCIIHYNHNHFVVFCGYRGGKALINDPARGRVLVPMEEFERSFDGMLMSCVPGENFKPGGKRPSVFPFFSEVISRYKKETLFLLISGALATVAGIISPVLSQIFLDQSMNGYENYQRPITTVLSALLLAVLFIQIVLTITDTLAKYRINRKAAFDAESTFFDHILSLPMEFFSRRMIGDLVSRQKSNEMISQGIIQLTAPLLQQAATIILYLIIMILYSPPLAITGLVLTALSLVLTQVINSRQMDMERAEVQNEAMVRGTAMFALNAIEPIKASGAEAGFYKNWAVLLANENNQSVKIAESSAWLTVLPQAMQMLSTAFITVTGAGLILKGAFTIGMLTSFQAFFSVFYAPVNSLIQDAKQLRQMTVQAERVKDVLDYPADPLEAKEDAEEIADLPGTLVVKDLTFGYGKMSRPVLNGISFEIGEGQSLGIAGASGCGKSTLLSLLLGLYPRWSGEIICGGYSIDVLSRKQYSRFAGVVRQEPMLFPGTVRDNLKLWSSDFSDEDMIRAAKDALIHDEIMEREGGYDSIVLPQGQNFSGGQRQKLELARALMGGRKLLILDEATSALDSITEDKILKNLKNRGITTIVVAHRLSALRDCDLILVLKNGRIAEQGTQQELLATEGIYRKLAENGYE